MRKYLFAIVFAAAGAVAPAAQADAPAQAKRPEAGAAAPEFTAHATGGKTVKLADFKGKQVVVLAFFPKIFTGG